MLLGDKICPTILEPSSASAASAFRLAVLDLDVLGLAADDEAARGLERAGLDAAKAPEERPEDCSTTGSGGRICMRAIRIA